MTKFYHYFVVAVFHSIFYFYFHFFAYKYEIEFQEAVIFKEISVNMITRVEEQTLLPILYIYIYIVWWQKRFFILISFSTIKIDDDISKITFRHKMPKKNTYSFFIIFFGWKIKLNFMFNVTSWKSFMFTFFLLLLFWHQGEKTQILLYCYTHIRWLNLVRLRCLLTNLLEKLNEIKTFFFRMIGYDCDFEDYTCLVPLKLFSLFFFINPPVHLFLLSKIPLTAVTLLWNYY